jgi:hypothetical protein
VPKGKAVLGISSGEGEGAAWEALRASLTTAAPRHPPRHSAAKAVEAPSTTTPSSTHLGSEHLHQDLWIDLHASTHSSTAEPFHWVYEVFSAIISSPFSRNYVSKYGKSV